MVESRDLKEWTARVVAKTFTGAKLAELSEKAAREMPRMRHPALEAMFRK